MAQAKEDADSNDPTLEAIEESAYRFYDHIWTLLQQNSFFIAHGFYVFPNGEKWTVDELKSHAEHMSRDDDTPTIKERLQ